MTAVRNFGFRFPFGPLAFKDGAGAAGMPVMDHITANSKSLTVVEHSLAAAKLSILRAKATPVETFRRTLKEISIVLLTEAARDWETSSIKIQTPLKEAVGRNVTREVALVPILRAGLGMLEGMIQVLPDAAVGHIGLYRDEQTLRSINYFVRLPLGLSQMQVVLIDPMLATGNSACTAVSLLKEEGARRIQFICAISSPPGIQQLQTSHPDVAIVTAAVDPELNRAGFIVPGLGDAGDRCFGTG